MRPDDDSSPSDGKGVGAGINFRPFVRLGRFELSIPVEFGRHFGLKDSYRWAGFNVEVGFSSFESPGFGQPIVIFTEGKICSIIDYLLYTALSLSFTLGNSFCSTPPVV